ncbi:hypothetical protein Droror1_Dr00018310 [Drosera rotundifolia]
MKCTALVVAIPKKGAAAGTAKAAAPVAKLSTKPLPPTQAGMRGEGKKSTSRGRQRIEIAPIKDKPKRHSTFNKRKDGFFKMASELIVSDFLQGRPSSSSFNPTSNISDYASMLHKYNSEYQLVKQKMKRSSDDGSDHENNGGFWWGRSMDGLEINELDQYSKSLEGLRDSVVTKVKQIESNLVAVHNEPQMTS